jgi:hypothetical protein
MSILGSMLIRSTTCSAFSYVFSSNLNRPQSYEMSGRFLKTLRKSGDFQAEYGGSIPFTRSNAVRLGHLCLQSPRLEIESDIQNADAVSEPAD